MVASPYFIVEISFCLNVVFQSFLFKDLLNHKVIYNVSHIICFNQVGCFPELCRSVMVIKKNYNHM